MSTSLIQIDNGQDIVPYADDPDVNLRRNMRFALIAVVVLIFGLGAAAVLVPIGGAVLGGGKVSVESRVKRIAHPAGGIITQIYVENGDKVNKGDPLIRFDDTVSGADAQLSTLTVDQLLAQRARLEAERLGSPVLRFPPELTSRKDAGAQKAMADEMKLFTIRRSESAGIIAQLRARMVQYMRQIDGYNAQIAALDKQQALIQPERQGVRELWEKDLVTINRLNQLERTSVDMEGNVAALRATIAQTQARISEAQEQIIQLSEARRSEAGTQLAQVNTVLNQQQVRSVSAGDLQDRSLMRAPYSGTVDKLAFSTIGDVVKPAETIMEIVPDNDRLIVEAAISPTDVDQVRAGQQARIRFTAFNMTTTPEFDGKVLNVAAERTTEPESGNSFFMVRIEIAGETDSSAKKLALRPGMPAEVYIETGSRSMLSYLTKPLRDQLQRAFRDN